MKKQDLFKFSLTAMCVAVLSACGSSGGGSLAVENTPTTPSTNANSNTGANNSAELAAAQKAAQEAAAQKAAAEKAAAEAAAKQAAAEKAAAAAKTAAEKAAAEKAAAEAKAAAEKAAAEKAAKEAAAKAAADQAAAVKKAAEEAAKKALADKEAADKAAAKKAAEEAAAKKAAEEAAKAAAAANDKANPLGSKDILTATPDTTRTVSFVGMKQTVKNQSNLVTNSSSGKDSTSDVPTPMAVQNPHPSLDTIVVAEPNPDAAAARVYLEDFDTRFSTRRVTAPNQKDTTADEGNRVLSNIYVKGNTNGMGEGFNPEIEKQRKSLKDAVNAATKTLNAAKAAQKKIDDELAVVNANIGKLGGDPRWGGTAAEIGAVKIESDREYKKKSDLIGKQADAKKDVDTATSAELRAQMNLNVFTLDNKEPTVTVKQRTDDSLGASYFETKTSTIGTDSGTIWVMGSEDVATKHQNYTERSTKANEAYQVKNGFIYKGKDVNGNLIVTGYRIEDVKHQAALKDGESLNSRKLDNTVAEIYGYRSKARHDGGKDGFTAPVDLLDWSLNNPNKAGTSYTDVPENNLPLVNDYFGAKLTNVQYGRVTTALHGKAATDEYLKKGLPLDGSVPTYVASFGKYGEEGTENHYFYRGINNVGATELTKLKEDTKNGVITYEGHAVTYGLNNNYRGDVAIPTAVGARAGFVSGNHATLAVNLANNEVTGNIYNKWYDSVNSPDKLHNVKLVDFKGVIADNGNIAGTAIRRDNKATGVFGATLFGNGAEVGGSFASDKHTKDEQWGGVLGGIRVPATPAALKDAGMSVGTDGKN